MYEVGSHKAETAVTWDFLNMTYCNALGCLNTHKGKTARKGQVRHMEVAVSLFTVPP